MNQKLYQANLVVESASHVFSHCYGHGQNTHRLEKTHTKIQVVMFEYKTFHHITITFTCNIALSFKNNNPEYISILH